KICQGRPSLKGRIATSLGPPHVVVREYEPPISKLVRFNCHFLNLIPVGEHVEPASNNKLHNRSFPSRFNGLLKADKVSDRSLTRSDLMFLSKMLNIKNASGFSNTITTYSPIILALVLLSTALAIAGSFTPRVRILAGSLVTSVAALVGYAELIGYTASNNCQGTGCITQPTGSETIF